MKNKQALLSRFWSLSWFDTENTCACSLVNLPSVSGGTMVKVSLKLDLFAVSAILPDV